MKYVEIIRGQDKTFSMQFTDVVEGKYYDLTNTEDVKIYFKNEDGSNTENVSVTDSNVTITNATSGLVQVTLSDTITSTLKIGKGQMIEAELISDSGATVKIVQVPNILNVSARL